MGVIFDLRVGLSVRGAGFVLIVNVFNDYICIPRSNQSNYDPAFCKLRTRFYTILSIPREAICLYLRCSGVNYLRLSRHINSDSTFPA